MKHVFFGADLFDGKKILKDHALLVEDGVISALMPVGERPRDREATDLSGGTLSPGFIDVQVNGGGGTLFNNEPTPEGIDKIAKAHRRFGTTSLLPTVITDSPKILDDALRAGKAAYGKISGVLGLHVEGPFIDPLKKGAHPAEFIRALTDADIEALAAAKAGVLLLTLAPNTVSPDHIRGLVHAGIRVSLGHSNATDIESIHAFDAGAP